MWLNPLNYPVFGILRKQLLYTLFPSLKTYVSMWFKKFWFFPIQKKSIRILLKQINDSMLR